MIKKIIIKKCPYDEKCTEEIVDIALEEVLKIINMCPYLKKRDRIRAWLIKRILK